MFVQAARFQQSLSYSSSCVSASEFFDAEEHEDEKPEEELLAADEVSKLYFLCTGRAFLAVSELQFPALSELPFPTVSELQLCLRVRFRVLQRRWAWLLMRWAIFIYLCMCRPRVAISLSYSFQQSLSYSYSSIWATVSSSVWATISDSLWATVSSRLWATAHPVCTPQWRQEAEGRTTGCWWGEQLLKTGRQEVWTGSGRVNSLLTFFIVTYLLQDF